MGTSTGGRQRPRVNLFIRTTALILAPSWVYKALLREPQVFINVVPFSGKGPTTFNKSLFPFHVGDGARGLVCAK